MDRTTSKSTITENTLLLISLLGEYHTPLKEFHYPQDKGLVLCNGALATSSQWTTSLFNMEDTESIISIRRKSFSVANNCLALYSIKRYDSIEYLENFLYQDNFQSVILSCDLIREDLLDIADTISLPFCDFHPDKTWYEELNACKQHFRNTPEQLSVVFDLARTSDYFYQIIQDNPSMLVTRLTIVGEIYMYWYRTIHSESETQKKRDELYSCLDELRYNNINATDESDLADTFINAFNTYLDSNKDISYSDCNKVEHQALYNLNEGQTILWDENYYFISQPLMKKICSPLLQNIAERQLLASLAREGIIEPYKNSTGNYTRKRTVTTAYCPVRMSFYYLPKERIQTPHNISPEERNEQKCTLDQ